eukprot:4894022-Pyramimonas_sp.AAC.1
MRMVRATMRMSKNAPSTARRPWLLRRRTCVLHSVGPRYARTRHSGEIPFGSPGGRPRNTGWGG